MEAWKRNERGVWVRHIIHRLVRISGSHKLIVQFSPAYATDDDPVELVQVSPGCDDFYPPIYLHSQPQDIQLHKTSEKVRLTFVSAREGVGDSSRAVALCRGGCGCLIGRQDTAPGGCGGLIGHRGIAPGGRDGALVGDRGTTRASSLGF